MLEAHELADHVAHVVVCDELNQIDQKLAYASRIEVDRPLESVRVDHG